MRGGSAGLRRWTQRFTLASAASFLGFLLAAVAPVDRTAAVIIGAFGFVCPMIFGMGYLLLPAYAGTTLVDQRLAGVHFAFAYAGVGLLVLGWLLDPYGLVFAVGVASWASGVVVFVGGIAATVLPELGSGAALPDDNTDWRASTIAAAALPVAVGYLVVGTVGLVATVAPVRIDVTLPAIAHYYAAGFGTVLVYALSARLLVGFFHVSLPGALVSVVVVAGALAPALLGALLWADPWFRLGGGLAAAAMVGYAALVALVGLRADRLLVGFCGIALGAAAGVAAVAAGFAVAVDAVGWTAIEVHGMLVLAGFFPLTIVGYAYLFFPASEGQFPGATPAAARSTIAFLAVGAALQAVGIGIGAAAVETAGVAASVAGAVGYSYLLGRRFAN